MNRKHFIRNCGFICLGSAAVVSLFESCSASEYFAKFNFSSSRLAVNKSEFILSLKSKIRYRKFILLRHEQFKYPICIYRHSENDFTALHTECTHRNCELKPNPYFLACPCHGSEFTSRGIVKNPPAEINLKQFTITIDDETVFVHL